GACWCAASATARKAPPSSPRSCWRARGPAPARYPRPCVTCSRAASRPCRSRPGRACGWGQWLGGRAHLRALAPGAGPARQVLRVAAVAGRQVPHPLLAAVAVLDEGQLDGVLREVVAYQLL